MQRLEIKCIGSKKKMFDCFIILKSNDNAYEQHSFEIFCHWVSCATHSKFTGQGPTVSDFPCVLFMTIKSSKRATQRFVNVIFSHLAMAHVFLLKG